MSFRSSITSAAVLAAALGSLVLFGAATRAAAEEGDFTPHSELSIMGGVQALNQNDTALPDAFINVPAVVAATYHFSPSLAVEGEFTWMIPLKQQVDLGGGQNQDRKNPDVLVYMANLRATLPGRVVRPYLTGGAGAVTFLSNTDPDRLPQLDQSQTAFAANLGAGLTYGLTERLSLRADAREIVAFPSKDTAGLSSGGEADEVWMERGTLGFAYRF